MGVVPELCADATLTPTMAKAPAVTVAMATVRMVRARRRPFPAGGTGSAGAGGGLTGAGIGPAGGGAILQFGGSLPGEEPVPPHSKSSATTRPTFPCEPLQNPGTREYGFTAT